jgi:hypothetical protein
MTRCNPQRRSARIPSLLALMAATLYVPTVAQAQFVYMSTTAGGTFSYSDQSGFVFSQDWGNDNDPNPSDSVSLSPSTYMTPAGDTVVASAYSAYTTTPSYATVGANLQLSVSGPSTAQASLQAWPKVDFMIIPAQNVNAWINFLGCSAYVSPLDSAKVSWTLSAVSDGLFPIVDDSFSTTLGPGTWAFPSVYEIGTDPIIGGWVDLDVQLTATIDHTAGGPASYVDFSDASAAPPVPTPEPASLTLLLSALLGFAGASYLRRRRAKA